MEKWLGSRLWRNEAEYCLKVRGPVQGSRGSKAAQRLLPWPGQLGLHFKNGREIDA